MVVDLPRNIYAATFPLLCVLLHNVIVSGASETGASRVISEGAQPLVNISACGSLACSGDDGTSSYTPRYSFHSCIGETQSTRTCIFRNLYYHVPTSTFVYFECPDDPPRIKLAGQTYTSYNFSGLQDPNQDPYFFTKEFVSAPSGGTEHDGKPFPDRLQVTPDVRRLPAASMPEASTIADINGLSVLWYFFQHSSHSYGHCILNDWYPMFLMLGDHFGAKTIPTNFRVLGLCAKEPKVCAHYMEGWIGQKIVQFKQHMDATSSGRTWVRLCNLVVGDGGYWWAAARSVRQSNKDLPLAPTMFNSRNWELFRASVFRAYNLDPDKVNQDIIVTVLDKPVKERRRILNVPEIVQHLQAAFPTINVTVMNHALLSAKQQLELMSQTTIFVAPQGSASFRLVFLQQSARIIYIGTPLDNEGPSSQNWNWTPFFEVPRYFPTNYVKFVKYPMDPKKMHEYNTSDAGPNWGQHWTNYQASVQVDVYRLEALVRQAIWEYHAELRWRKDAQEMYF